MFVDIIKAIVLGIIEGLTEFLPVSSTGHLIIANKYLSFQGEFANLFAVVIQTGAIFSVILYFRKKVMPERGHFKAYVSRWSKVAIAVIPAVVLALLFEEKIDAALFNPTAVAIALVIGAILLIVIENKHFKVLVSHEDQITYRAAFFVGLAQCMALFPGMSRSASTIIGAIVIGFSRALAAEFSFYLAIPTLLGAGIYKMAKYGGALSESEWILLGVGTLVSFVVAYVVIAGFMNYIKKHDFKVFAYYRIILGVLVLIFAR